MQVILNAHGDGAAVAHDVQQSLDAGNGHGDIGLELGPKDALEGGKTGGAAGADEGADGGRGGGWPASMVLVVVLLVLVLWLCSYVCVVL